VGAGVLPAGGPMQDPTAGGRVRWGGGGGSGGGSKSRWALCGQASGLGAGPGRARG
jgi:hypothetical protein